MAINPMQRKAQNSFLLGILVTLLITGIIIGLLVIQLTKMTKEQKAAEAAKKEIYVLKSDVESGQSVTSDMLESKKMDITVIPSNALNQADLTKQTDVKAEDGKTLIKKVNVVSKINLKKGTIITSDMIKVEGELENDVRKVEYNTIVMGSQLESGKYVDIRLKLPSGGDYIVASHKKIEIPEIEGTPSLNTMWLNLNETEILSISCALVESYKIEGALLYATEYIEPGLQEAASVTYLPSNETINLIKKDPNCVNTAAAAIANELIRIDNGSEEDYRGKKDVVRVPVNNALNENSETSAESVKSKLQEEAKAMQEARQKYLESLGGAE
jgi:type II secretory pathway pseudopilin PulG